MKTKVRPEKIEAIKHLRSLLKPGTTVYCVIRSVASSGMSRRIDFYTIKKGELLFLSGWIAQALDYKRDPRKDGLLVQGCGMDMGFHVVYEVGRTLYPKGFVPARAGAMHGRNGTPADKVDPDGGYALRHRWI